MILGFIIACIEGSLKKYNLGNTNIQMILALGVDCKPKTYFQIGIII